MVANAELAIPRLYFRGGGPFDDSAVPVIVPERDFGLRGDGSNEYVSWMAMAAGVNALGRARIVFPEGRTYYLGEKKTVSPSNGIVDATWQDLSFLDVNLNGSRVVVKGDFDRPLDGVELSNTSSVTPFRFLRCRNVAVSNGEIDMQVDRMTKGDGVGEAANACLSFYASQRIALRNLNLHHCPSDGVYLGATGGITTKDVFLDQVNCHHNGRLGLAITGAYRVYSRRCQFNFQGNFAGTYGGHNPRAGVDVEPNNAPPVYDSLTGGIVFHTCEFSENAVSALVCSSYTRTLDVTMVKCYGTSSVGDIVRVYGGIQELNVLDCDFYNISLSPAFGANAGSDVMVGLVRGNRFRGDFPTYRPLNFVSSAGDNGGPTMDIVDNDFEVLGTVPHTLTYMLNWASLNGKFRDNRIFVAKEVHDGETSDLFADIRAGEVHGNTWTTDLESPLIFTNQIATASAAHDETYVGSWVVSNV